MKSSEHASLTTMIMNKHLVIAALSAFVPLAATGANVVADPGFELAATGSLPSGDGNGKWDNFSATPTNIVIQSTIFHSGIQALKLNALTGPQGFGIVYQNTGTTLTTSLVENTTWNYSFWVYTPGGTGSFTYEFMSSNVGNADLHEASAVIDASSLLPNTWTQISGTFTTLDTATNSDRMKANFYPYEGAGTTSFYIDDVSLSSVPEPASLGLLALAPILMLRRRRD